MPADPDRERRIADAESVLTDEEIEEFARRLTAGLYSAWQRGVRQADNPSPDASEKDRWLAERVRQWRANRPPPPQPKAPLTEDDLRKRPRYRGSRRQREGT